MASRAFERIGGLFPARSLMDRRMQHAGICDLGVTSGRSDMWSAAASRCPLHVLSRGMG